MREKDWGEDGGGHERGSGCRQRRAGEPRVGNGVGGNGAEQELQGMSTYGPCKGESGRLRTLKN